MAFSTPTKSPSPPSFSRVDDKDATLIGAHCQDPHCNQLDFLPFKCESCFGTYCLDHRSETAHRCAKAGDWARKRAAARAASSTESGNGGRRLEQERMEPCAGKGCRVVTSTEGRNPGVVCDTCRRTYCLNHRVKEDHDCKNLIPLGVQQRKSDPNSTQEKTKAAFGRLRAWGSKKSEEAQKATSRVLPKAKPSTVSNRLIATNNLKKTAKGDEKLPAEKRVYLFVEAEAATTTSKFPKGEFFYSKDWVVGRVLDAAAKALQIQNVNNASTEETDKLRVFHVEGGRLLEFGEKVGGVLASGNTIVLLRGVGPAVPDLIEC